MSDMITHLISPSKGSPFGRATICCNRAITELPKQVHDLTTEGSRVTCPEFAREPKMDFDKVIRTPSLSEQRQAAASIPGPPPMNYVEASREAIHLAFKYAETSGKGSSVSEILDDATKIRKWLTS